VAVAGGSGGGSRPVQSRPAAPRYPPSARRIHSQKAECLCATLDAAACSRGEHRALEQGTDMAEYGTMRVKSGLAEMLKGGVIMDVVDAEQAKVAEEAGACAVMALERVPADIRA